MNKVIELFRKWYRSTYSEEANFSDDRIVTLFAAFQAGYEINRLRPEVLRSPVKERQTYASAASIAKQLRRELENDSLQKQSAEETIVRGS